MLRSAKLLVLVGVFALTHHSSGAYTLAHGEYDGAIVSLQDGPERAFYLDADGWGTQYYDGVPPAEVGGLGDGVLCMEVFTADDFDTHAHGCVEGFPLEFESLRTFHYEGPITLAVEKYGEFVGGEVATLVVTVTGKGPIYPGARAQLNPSPGAEVEYTLLRNADVKGSVTSASVGFDFTGALGTLKRANCLAPMLGVDNTQACRF